MNTYKKWNSIILEEIKKDYIKDLVKFLYQETKKNNIFPIINNILRALKETEFGIIKVIILGQDPYYKLGLADGLAFSVPDNIEIPETLKNIFTELKNDTNISFTKRGNLLKWAKQGVLLLNCILTVTEGIPQSHKGKGWEIFTDTLIKAINDYHKNNVFILWGSYAHQKKKLIDKNKHLIIESTHPSPLSANINFFGSRCFSKTNDYLKKHSKKEINWNLNE